MLQEPEIRDALRSVMDPEMGMSVVDLGMIREVAIQDGAVEISMLLTTPFCPLANMLTEQVRTAAAAVPGANSVKVTLLKEQWNRAWMQHK